MKTYKYWLGLSNIANFHVCASVNDLRAHIKATHGNVGYGFQVV